MNITKQEDLNENIVPEPIIIDETDMTPAEKIEYWKKIYEKIYLSVYDEQEFVWRKIKRREYTEIMSNSSEEGVDDVIEYRQFLTLQACVLSHSNEDLNNALEEYPGLLTSLSGEILKKSGFAKPLTIEL